MVLTVRVISYQRFCSADLATFTALEIFVFRTHPHYFRSAHTHPIATHPPSKPFSAQGTLLSQFKPFSDRIFNNNKLLPFLNE